MHRAQSVRVCALGVRGICSEGSADTVGALASVCSSIRITLCPYSPPTPPLSSSIHLLVRGWHRRLQRACVLRQWPAATTPACAAPRLLTALLGNPEVNTSTRLDERPHRFAETTQ